MAELPPLTVRLNLDTRPFARTCRLLAQRLAALANDLDHASDAQGEDGYGNGESDPLPETSQGTKNE